MQAAYVDIGSLLLLLALITIPSRIFQHTAIPFLACVTFRAGGNKLSAVSCINSCVQDAAAGRRVVQSCLTLSHSVAGQCTECKT